MTPTFRPGARLALSDGTIFEGDAIGTLASGTSAVVTGEVVFNTSMSGYQEIITDPSYAGQVIAFTYPHIGNYGVTALDDESRRPFCRGIVLRDLATHPSNWRSGGDLESYLTNHGIAGLSGIDTRRLTRHVREAGAMPCAMGTASAAELIEAAKHEPGTLHQDLVSEVTTAEPYILEGEGPFSIVAYDFGIKATMVRKLRRLGRVEIVPAGTPASEVLSRQPDGVMLSNGPGDPAALPAIAKEVEKLLGEVPLFGICLGHQLLATALGGKTYKLGFGHHGANHPVRRISTGVVEVTSQNHGFAVMADSLDRVEVTHVNLNDGVIEGFRALDVPAFAVQYHPEAGPGPHDADYLFGAFRELMETGR